MNKLREISAMQLKQQKPGLISSRSLGTWKVWIVIAVIATSLLLSSCSGEVTDYKTDPGDPSLYKELVNKAEREIATMTRKLDSTTQENSKLKVGNAKLRALKLKDVDFSQRDQALDEREKTLSEREGRLKQEQDELEGARQQLNDKLYQEGVKAGLLKKAEEQNQDLKKELSDTKGQLGFSTFLNTALLFSIFALAVYIFLDKYGVLKPITHENIPFSPEPINAIDVPNLFKDKSSSAKSIEKAKDSSTKSLPSGADDKRSNGQSTDSESPA